MRHEQASQIAKQVIEMLKQATPEIGVAGSLRRGKPIVKDIEIVARHDSRLWRHMDMLLGNGDIKKALYGGNKTIRWGDKYRGFTLPENDLTIEVFTYDDNNRGVVTWLRTGPGDANTYIMTMIDRENAPIYNRDGHVWRRRDQKKLRVNTEHEWFQLLGMPYINATDRDIQEYRRYIHHPNHRWLDPDDSWLAPPEFQQMSLF